MLKRIHEAHMERGKCKRREIVTDDGGQYNLWQFRAFTREWRIHNIFSSPRYPRSNGMAGSTVKTVKRLFKKCHRSNQNILKGLLILRNTPLKCGKSPAKLMMDRILRDKHSQQHHPQPSRVARKNRRQTLPRQEDPN